MVTEAEARRQRPVASMVIAMVVATVVAIGWYYLGRPDESTRPVKSQPWATWVKAGRADGKLAVLAPQELPAGWRATSASYATGVSPHWHLGTLTDNGKYVGIEESHDSADKLVEQYVDENATQGEDVAVGGETWQVWTDAGGDYALIRTLDAPTGDPQRVLVVGSAPDGEIRDFAASLSDTSTPTD